MPKLKPAGSQLRRLQHTGIVAGSTVNTIGTGAIAFVGVVLR